MDPTLLIMIVGFGGFMYLFMIRPQQKRMKAQQAVLAALTPGTRVLLTSGIFATIRHLGERHAIVELAPDVLITIIKGNIARPTTDDEEEFEFDDGDDEGAVAVDAEVESVEGEEVAEELDEATPTSETEEFDPRPAEDISAEELQRRYDAN